MIMKTIKEITFVNETKRVTYKLYQYEQETIRKTKVLKQIIDKSFKAYDYEDTKVKVKMYALHQESEIKGIYLDKLICETESHATILTIIKAILHEYINEINMLQTPKNTL